MSSELYVVTGGGTGIGRDLTLRLAEADHTVVVAGRRKRPLLDTAAAAPSGLVETVAGDVSTVAGTQALLAAVGDRPVTGIAAAAGGQGDFLRGDSDPATIRRRWSDALDKNFYSALMPVEALIPGLRDQRGRIVLISSTSALNGRGGPYAAAKAALSGYSLDLAQRLGARGITANIVAPGYVGGTEFFEADGLGPVDPTLERAAAATLVGRIGVPRDISHIVLSLLDERAGWTTGQLITPNGGVILQH
jgi:3-oxoacyl-[acyl-carrier protein] reductase